MREQPTEQSCSRGRMKRSPRGGRPRHGARLSPSSWSWATYHSECARTMTSRWPSPRPTGPLTRPRPC